MNKFELAELELNKSPVPLIFHDMVLIDLKFCGDSLEMKFMLPQYMDDFNLLDDDDHVAILKVVYSGIKIEKTYIDGNIDFQFICVSDLSEKNGLIILSVFNEDGNFYFDIDFKFKDYKWSVTDIVSVRDYSEYEYDIYIYQKEVQPKQEKEKPSWAKI